MVLRFSAISNKTYTVDHRVSPASGWWNRLADVAAASSNRVVEITDAAVSSGSPRRVYRLVTPRTP